MDAGPPEEMAEEGKIPAAVNIPVRKKDSPHEEKHSAFPDTQVSLRNRKNSTSSQQSVTSPNPSPSPASYNPAGTTSNPFIRAHSHRGGELPKLTLKPSRSSITGKRRKPSPTRDSLQKRQLPTRHVPVGTQRLHHVQLPDLTLEPIYWSPLVGLDNATVTRGTWFYKDSMWPVETELANALEKGYIEVQAWTEEWAWELESAVRVGQDAEPKIQWPLPKFPAGKRPGTSVETQKGEDEVEIAAMDSTFDTEMVDEPPAVEEPVLEAAVSGEFVIYADGRTAHIIRASYLDGFSGVNKRPLASIKRGKPLGTAVVRGFDEDEWKKIYGEKFGLRPGKLQKGKKRKSNDEITEASEGGKDVTDLVLVIHGIGQKLSERMESFHFTHATNSFRRLVNHEVDDPIVKPILREQGVNIACLPINWRATIKFDSEFEEEEAEDPLFTLEDITPKTIPAVRNLIGDVMLDIPYYLSHHKNKMVSAVVKEANRVYRLWCKNNPGFVKNGKVHLIAHSLGCAIALDVLSRQPTSLTEEKQNKRSSRASIEWSAEDGNESDDERHKFFDFDTTNLFCVGSPAGFFLLLNRKQLVPRKGRKKKDEVAAERGPYGCLSVQNVYNILHVSDRKL